MGVLILLLTTDGTGHQRTSFYDAYQTTLMAAHNVGAAPLLDFHACIVAWATLENELKGASKGLKRQTLMLVVLACWILLEV